MRGQVLRADRPRQRPMPDLFCLRGQGDRRGRGGVEGVESGAVCVFSSLEGPQVLEGHMFAGRETH